MEVNLKKLERVLSTAEVMYLSTSVNDKVSSRPVSPLNIERRLYVRTSAGSRKAEEMLKNPNIAVCVGDFYLTGKAKPLGSAFDNRNAEIKAAYILRYPDSFGEGDEFIQSGEMFFELLLENVSEWIYKDGIPVGLAKKQLNY